jgi:hypothetical protein
VTGDRLWCNGLCRVEPARTGTFIGIILLCNDAMSQSTGSTEQEYANLTVSAEFRDKVRVAKAEDGLSYEDYLKQYLPVGGEA